MYGIAFLPLVRYYAKKTCGILYKDDTVFNVDSLVIVLMKFPQQFTVFLKIKQNKISNIPETVRHKSLLYIMIDCESQFFRENIVHNFDMSGEDYIIVNICFIYSIYCKILKITHPCTTFVLHAQNR